jgi:C_GCAxxG_C_C family probable redox protein
MDKVEQAVACFREGFSCSQAVFSTYGEPLGVDREMALRIAGAFGGGMARMGETCGAVTGALMVIGLKHGQHKTGDTPAREKTYELVRAFAERFKARNNTLRCKELLGLNLSIPEERQQFLDRNLMKTFCPRMVQDAAEILEELI